MKFVVLDKIFVVLGTGTITDTQEKIKSCVSDSEQRQNLLNSKVAEFSSLEEAKNYINQTIVSDAKNKTMDTLINQSKALETKNHISKGITDTLSNKYFLYRHLLPRAEHETIKRIIQERISGFAILKMDGNAIINLNVNGYEYAINEMNQPKSKYNTNRMYAQPPTPEQIHKRYEKMGYQTVSTLRKI